MFTANRQDLTQGVIWRKILAFFFPLFLGSLLQQLYTTADAVIVGRFAGKDALASIDAIYSLAKFPIILFRGLSAAAAILISQSYGAKDNESLSQTVHTAAALSIVGGGVLSAIGLLAARPAMGWLNVPDDILGGTLSYVRITFCGMPATLAYSLGSGILRAVGDTRTPLAYMAVCNILNVALDALFVGVFRWDVAGAAAATVMSQCVSAALIVRRLARTDAPYRLFIRKIHLNKGVAARILRMGAPMSLQNALYPVSNMALQSGINTHGVDSIAAWALCGKLDLLVWVAADTFSDAISIFAAQNFGAKAYDRIKRGVRVCLAASVLVVGILSAILIAWCAPLGGMIISDRNVIDTCASIMRAVAPFYVAYALSEGLSGAIRGMGDTFRPMLVTLAGTCGLRVAWVMFLPQARGSLLGLLAAYPASWIAAAAALAVLYFIKKASIGQTNAPIGQN
ncbi:MAG: MATE family efflux transporter [Oscillospiraceae bacterium]|nr:MATE family efflux transporter [Oscillospiraceae bacterium]